MIYINKVSKKTNKQEALTLSYSKAREYLESLRPQDFLYQDYFLLGTDDENEKKSLFNYFTEEFFIETKTEMFDMFKVNPNVSKKDRLRNNQIKVNAIKKFSEKIKEKLYGEEVSYILGPDTFEILVKKNKFVYEITCSYKLDILNIFVLDEINNTSYSSNEVHNINKTVNEIFRKQRYYYKKGKLL